MKKEAVEKDNTPNPDTWRNKFKEHIRRGHRNRLRAWRSLTFTNVVWLFVIGSVVGYITETLFLLVKAGIFESRQGLVYGPFSQIYGMGAIILAFLLLPLKERGKLWLFFGSGIIGGLFEAACSLVQEKIFHTVSWVYTKDMFPLFGGRTSLLYMLYWSILGYAYIQYIYPRIISMVNKVPRKLLNKLTFIIFIFMTINILISAMAVYRWSARTNDKPANNIVAVWLDERFDDKRMRRIYPNMRFPKAGNEK